MLLWSHAQHAFPSQLPTSHIPQVYLGSSVCRAASYEVAHVGVPRHGHDLHHAHSDRRGQSRVRGQTTKGGNEGLDKTISVARQNEAMILKKVTTTIIVITPHPSNTCSNIGSAPAYRVGVAVLAECGRVGVVALGFNGT